MLSREIKEQKLLLLQEKLKREARKSFYTYCRLRDPIFYTQDKKYLENLTATLEKAYKRELINPETGEPYRKIKIHLPPRFGKSLTVTNFTTWCLGQDPTNRIISMSYNEILSQRLGKQTRDIIDQNNLQPENSVFSDIFPFSKLNKKDSSKQIWALEGQFFNFLASSPNATVTGIGANIIILDDLIKDHWEACNQRIKDEHWDWYVNTLQSRFENDPLIIVVMTRWATDDIAGKLEDSEPGEWYTVLYEAYDKETDTMLCESIQPKKQYLSHKKKSEGSTISYAIFMANYHQKPFNAEGSLYKNLIEYEILPENIKSIIAYVDPADKGKDHLCMIIATLGKDGFAYILDILFSDEDQDKTAPLVCEMLTKWKVNKLRIESNDSLGFFRLIRDMMPKYKNGFTILEPFHQTKNKEARIKGNSGLVANYIRFPYNWKYMHSKFHSALVSYQAKGKNSHDDAPDAITGLLEMFMTKSNGWDVWN